ncbi:omptin family outer membrane protease [candidate division GN15 bacterium]|nr:omptin family outer membrane protease [candidate division GN15 bacterium]
MTSKRTPMRYLAAAVVALSLCYGPLSAQGNEPGDLRMRTFHVSIEPSLSSQFGHTTYFFDLSASSSTPGDITYLASELEFPIDQFMVGGSVRLQSYLGNVEDWSLTLSGYRSISQPRGIMTDADWITIVGGFDGMWSYTESDPEGTNTVLLFEFTKRVLERRPHSFGLVAGFRWQRIVQDIDNFVGWQIDYENPGSQRVTFEYDNVPAIYYRVTYLMPHAGAQAALRFSEAVSLDLRAAYALTMADDYDDHIIRNKESTADGTGSAFLASLRGEWLLAQRKPGARPFIGVEAEFLTLKVEGDQKQFWYDDETGFERNPQTGEIEEVVRVERGTTISGLPHEFTSTQFRVGLRFGYRF